MGFFKRLFSADYRAAVSAEAAGDLELAAERYALAGQLPAAVRVHMARAARAETRADEIAALYDALHWAERGTACYVKASRALGRALLARARAEGIATPRDRERVREAAWLLGEAGDHETAAGALESIGDAQAAAEAYRRGGHVEKLEELLAVQQAEAETERAVREAFARYELSERGGQRDDARDAIEACVRAARDKAAYRRLLDELESRLLTGGLVTLKPRRGPRVVVTARDPIWLGRDPLADLVLRGAGVSRRHARIERAAPSVDEEGFVLRDAGSRAGTCLAQLPIAGAVSLSGEGELQLGDQATLAYAIDETGDASISRLEVLSGFDAGARLVGVADESTASLEPAGLRAAIAMRRGRPFLRGSDGVALALNGNPLSHGELQLVRGDVLALDGEEIDVG